MGVFADETTVSKKCVLGKSALEFDLYEVRTEKRREREAEVKIMERVEGERFVYTSWPLGEIKGYIKFRSSRPFVLLLWWQVLSWTS